MSAKEEQLRKNALKTKLWREKQKLHEDCIKEALKNAQEENAFLVIENDKLRKIEQILHIKYLSSLEQMTGQTPSCLASLAAGNFLEAGITNPFGVSLSTLSSLAQSKSALETRCMPAEQNATAGFEQLGLLNNYHGIQSKRHHLSVPMNQVFNPETALTLNMRAIMQKQQQVAHNSLMKSRNEAPMSIPLIPLSVPSKSLEFLNQTFDTSRGLKQLDDLLMASVAFKAQKRQHVFSEVGYDEITSDSKLSPTSKKPRNGLH